MEAIRRTNSGGIYSCQATFRHDWINFNDLLGTRQGIYAFIMSCGSRCTTVRLIIACFPTISRSSLLAEHARVTTRHGTARVERGQTIIRRLQDLFSNLGISKARGYISVWPCINHNGGDTRVHDIFQTAAMNKPSDKKSCEDQEKVLTGLTLDKGKQDCQENRCQKATTFAKYSTGFIKVSQLLSRPLPFYEQENKPERLSFVPLRWYRIASCLQIYQIIPVGDAILHVFSSPGQDNYHGKWTWRVHGAWSHTDN